MTTLTKEEKRDFIRRFLSESQYYLIDDILQALDSDGEFFNVKYLTQATTITVPELHYDELVCPLDALSDLINKYRSQGYTDIPIISWEGIHLNGTFQESFEQFEDRVEHYVKCWLSKHYMSESEIREKITQHEKAIRELRTRLNDQRD